MNNTAYEDSDEILNMYDDLLEQLIRLNDEYPQIKTMYEESKKHIESLESEISKQIKRIESLQQTIDKQQAALTKAETALKEQIIKAENQKESIESYLKNIESAASKAFSEIQGKKEESVSSVISTAEKCVSNIYAIIQKATSLLSDEPEIDYSDIDSIANLYEKYGKHMKNAMIVVKSGDKPWSGDYCFAVERIIGDKAFGKVFKAGKPYVGKTNTNDKVYSANEAYYSIYNGPSLESIRELLLNEKSAINKDVEFPF